MVKSKEFNVFLLYLFIGLMILTGSINTITTKVLTRLEGLKIEFEQHQWFITFGMFIGEMFSLIPYLIIIIKKRSKDAITIDGISKEDSLVIDSEKTAAVEPESEPENKNGEKSEKEEDEENKKEKELPPANNFIFAISAFCDLCASTLSTFAITYLTSSLYQMFRGIELSFIMLFSKIFLKNHIYRHHAIGVGTVIVGLCLVGLSAIINQGDSTAKNPIVGMCLLLCAQLFSSSQYVIQEKFLNSYSVNPFQLVGFEGFWGSLVYIILLIIFQNISCLNWGETLQKSICIKNEYNEWKIEDTLFAFRQMNDNIGIWFVYILYVVSIALYNIIGINLTKLVSSTARAVVDTVRTVFVWMFFLIPWPIRPKGSEEKFEIIQFFGFILLIVGTIIYNEIVELKFWNLDYYTRTQIAKRKKLEVDEEKNDPEVSPISPQEEEGAKEP